MHECARCGGEVEERYRFCPWCASPQRLKIVEFFRPHAQTDPGKALRVSCYLGPDRSDRHVRISVWSDAGAAEAAVSLGEPEARRLARFVLDTVAAPETLEDTVRLTVPDEAGTATN